MSPDEFRTSLKLLHMSQSDFARLIGIEARTARRYALGETPVPGAVRVLIGLMTARPEIVPVVERIAKGESVGEIEP